MIRLTVRFVGILAATILCVLQIPAAFAGPPLVTDDPETPGRGGWEINISHNIEKTRDEFLMETPLIDINYGLLENDQWKIEFPVLFLNPADEHGRWGVGDLEVVGNTDFSRNTNTSSWRRSTRRYSSQQPLGTRDETPIP